MKATRTYISNKFKEFNRQLFAGKLPPISVCLSDAKTFLGRISYKKRMKSDGTLEYYDFKLRINTRIDLSEQELEDTIIHEMIHYYIAVNRLEDTSSHGPVFLRIMKEINQRYNRHLSISFKGSEQQRNQMIDSKPRYHVIAVLSLKDGRKCIKVLPRIVPRILNYYNSMLKNSNVLSIKIYMSNNVYFNRYPNSGTLNAHILDEATIHENLKGAELMECDGKRICRNNK